MNVPMFVVDAFTSVAFHGNPAAVALVPFSLKISDIYKQKIAQEMNLSVTAFVELTDSEDSFERASWFSLRWFTPVKEIPLCGHATLASAAVLLKICGNKSKKISFKTLSGELHATNTENGLIALDLPQNKPVPVVADGFKGLLKAILNDLPYDSVLYSPTSNILLVRLPDQLTRSQLEAIQPDAEKMMSAKIDKEIVGVVVTLKGSEKNGCISRDQKVHDFVSRCFFPWYGIVEDFATGSAHTVLSPYWAEILSTTVLYAFQCSKRGGDLYLQLQENNRVSVAGHATIVLKGSFALSSNV